MSLLANTRAQLMITASLLLAVVLAPHIILAQNTRVEEDTTRREIFSIGIISGYALNDLTAAFALDSLGGLTSSAACGRFESGSGNGFVIGAVLEMPLTSKWRVSLLPEYAERSGTMEFPCVDPARTRLPDGTIVPALTNHIAHITHSAFATRLTGDYLPFEFPLQFSAGPFIALPMTSTYEVNERIIEPSSAEFVTGGQERFEGGGSFTGTLGVGVSAAARYRAPVGKRLTLMPEASYLYALTDEVKDAGLRVNSFRGSLALIYRFDRTEEPPPPPPPPVEPPSIPALAVALDAFPVDRDGERTDTLRVQLNRTIITELHPLLTYVFFDSNSSIIPARYNRRSPQQADAFNETNFDTRDNIEIYHNMLDIVGARLRRIPSATISITGSQPEVDPASSNQMTLATNRASNVREYLNTTWDIDTSRMTISARTLPATPSNPDKPDGAAENRRVEIASSALEVTEPVVVSDTVFTSTTTPLQLEPSVTAGAGVRDWRLDFKAAGRTIATLSGVGQPPNPMPWIPDSAIASLRFLPPSLTVAFTATDSIGQTQSAQQTMATGRFLEGDSIVYGAGFYSLILFDFNKATLGPAHLRTIDIVNSRTTSALKARVYGYTDRIGESDLNLQLSSDRANAVAKRLSAAVVEVIGKGINTQQYDNRLPEGRFYSRSVTIETQ